ncbi:hypothetical protein [Profundibacterium mesophilum]|nr:hypothetical protein [Profundibacterium mesophilum]
MKSIAEYFRDLAADDRYFGAEPPVPDADMLHRIAEREIQRRVEAKVEKNGVVLRQMAPPEPEDADTAPLDAAPADAVPAARPAPGQAVTPETGEAAEAGSVADKLSRIRAVVAKARASREADASGDAPIELPGTHARIGAAFPQDDSPVPFAPVELDAAPETGDDEAEPAETSSDALSKPTGTETAAGRHAAEEAERSKAERFAAEDAERAEAERLAAEEAERAEAERLAAEEAERAEAQRLASEEAERAEAQRLAAEDAERAEAERLAAEEAERAEAERLAAEDAERAEAEPFDDEAAIDAKLLAAREHAEAKAARIAASLKLGGHEQDIQGVRADDSSGSPFDAIESDMVAQDGTPAEAETEQVPVAATGHDTPPAPHDDAAETPAAPARPHARVIKLKRREFETALAAGEIEEYEDDASDDDQFVEIEDDGDAAELDDANPDAARRESGTAPEDAQDPLAVDVHSLVRGSSLDPEDEEELARELTEVERAAASRQPQEDARPRDGEPALERLLDVTNARLGDNEGNRRRSAIAHLKAAVAATKADKLLRGNRERDDAEALNRFRDDLAKVVRPRRPDAEGPVDAPARPRRPADTLASRPAPLVLVSELRVEDAGTSAPVRPRRIRNPEEAPGAPQDASRQDARGESFSDYVAKLGATELPDILEAAAAYCTYVEGQEHLSRPQLLRRAASLHPGGEITREQGLKSFGHLLRSGRIRKLGHGRFALAEEAKYRDAKRKSVS